MSVFNQWRKYLFGSQANNPQVYTLERLYRISKAKHPFHKEEKDALWKHLANEIERAVTNLDDEFFQDLADAARFLKGRTVSPEAEAIHWATLNRLCAGNPRLSDKNIEDLTKGEIRE